MTTHPHLVDMLPWQDVLDTIVCNVKLSVPVPTLHAARLHRSSPKEQQDQLSCYSCNPCGSTRSIWDKKVA
ncbi:hypothetical protein Pmani_005482 [Petrolisthes manimaculis]|uniref:Uncharacterized protein n=1 Tax=Petrolisthes manimaculis TaxID=1843537 RepID=A0AAE1QEH9_9EUCA|nr:hypothetical protein Pmani_005482 [Petrolisthes manimaculis]